MLLCFVKCAGCGVWCGGVEGAVEVSGGVALQAAFDLSAAAPFGLAAGCVGERPGVFSHAAHHDGVQRPVELAVPTTVQAMTDRLPGRCRDRRDARQLNRALHTVVM